VRYTLKKSEILRGRKIFQTIRKRGKKLEGNVLRCLVLEEIYHENLHTRPLLFGVIVSKAIKKAVDRNLIRRRIKESYRLNKKLLEIPSGERSRHLKLLFLYPKVSALPFDNPPFREIDRDMKSLLTAIAVGKYV